MPHHHLSYISPCLQFSRHEFSHCPFENLKGKKLLRNFCFRCVYNPVIDSSMDIYIHLSFLDCSMVKASLWHCPGLFTGWFGIVPGFAWSCVQNCHVRPKSVPSLSFPKEKGLSSREEYIWLHHICK